MNIRATNKTSTTLIWCVQVVFLAGFLAAWLLLPVSQRQTLLAGVTGNPPPRTVPLRFDTPVHIASLYDDAAVVTDQQLADVLRKVLPRFDRVRLRPNYVEHALRVWGSEIEFSNPDLISGPEMVRFLTDSASYMKSWQDAAAPILQPRPNGVSIRWGPDRTASVHHDHLITCMTEAGVSLDTPVYLPGHTLQVRDLMAEAIADFRLDEREVEWSVMTFGFWLGPQHVTEWQNAGRRHITFDLLAKRLMRDTKRHGVCLGTHRIYSLVVLLRLNSESGGDLISPQTLSAIVDYIEDAKQLISATPNNDGSWPPNWTDGAEADRKADPEEQAYRTVISTGHHLEWLAIAPESLHPSRTRIREAATWVIKNTLETPQNEIDDKYTYYSHVGNALALWRGTTPAEFWQRWRKTHPECEQVQDSAESVSDLDSSPSERDY
jgi:hypothetical protein